MGGDALPHLGLVQEIEEPHRVVAGSCVGRNVPTRLARLQPIDLLSYLGDESGRCQARNGGKAVLDEARGNVVDVGTLGDRAHGWFLVVGRV